MSTLADSSPTKAECMEWKYSSDSNFEVRVVLFTNSSTLCGFRIDKSSRVPTPLFKQDVRDLWKSLEAVDAYFQKNFPKITYQWKYFFGIPYRQVPTITFCLNPLYQLFVRFPSRNVSLEVAFFDTGGEILIHLINRLRDLKLHKKEGYEVSRLSYNGQFLPDDECFGLKFVEGCFDLVPSFSSYSSSGSALALEFSSKSA